MSVERETFPELPLVRDREPNARFCGALGEVRLFTAEGGIVLAVPFRHVGMDELRATLQRFDELIAQSGVLRLFADCSWLHGYAPEARRAFADWATRNWRRLFETHTLLGSSIIRMGFNIVSATLAPVGIHMKAYSDREEFEARFESALRQRWGA
jgi:hypothetical protein